VLTPEAVSGVLAGAAVLCAVTAAIHLSLVRTSVHGVGLAWPGAWLMLTLGSMTELASLLWPFGAVPGIGGVLLLAGLVIMAINFEKAEADRVLGRRGLMWAGAAAILFTALAALLPLSTWRVVLGVSVLLTVAWLAWWSWKRVSKIEIRLLFAFGHCMLAVWGVTALAIPVGSELAPASVLLVVSAEMERIRSSLTDLEETHRHSLRLTETDPLTGCPNRQALRAWFDNWEGGGQVSLVLIDVDDLKRINDLHGHTAGDEALRLVAGVLKESTRPGDLVVRWGGDEFVAVLRGAGRDAAKRRFTALIGILQKAADSFPYEHQLRVSWGVSTCASAAEIASSLAEADKHMYAMKRAKVDGDADVGR
jgi:diguanylate cyclase (GGDEF)-like protein